MAQIKNTLQNYGGGFNAFLNRVKTEDLQRSNLYSVFFTNIPDIVLNPDQINARYASSGATQILSNIGQAVNGVVSTISDTFGSAISFGYDLGRRFGLFKKVYGIFSPGSVDTIFGMLSSGDISQLADYQKMQETNIAVLSIVLPSSEINYEIEENHRLKQIAVQGKNEQKFAVTLRNFSSNRDYE